VAPLRNAVALAQQFLCLAYLSAGLFAMLRAFSREPPRIVEIGQDSAALDFGRPHAQLGKKRGEKATQRHPEVRA
jgi:hypothetical protein